MLLLYSPADDIVMKLLLQFKGIKLVNAEDSKLEAETQARAVIESYVVSHSLAIPWRAKSDSILG